MDGEPYNPDNPPRTLKLGRAEEWSITAKGANHPYHIHVNPFQMMEPGEDGKLHPGDWKDTQNVEIVP